jgi:Fe-Mn family superoxide dismutase
MAIMHQLPPLPYAYDALEPYLDAATMTVHHDRHHQAYIDKLNTALEKYPDWATHPVENLLKNLDQVPEAIRLAVRNHGGGHANHSLFWSILAPAGEVLAPVGNIKEALDDSFGGFESFKSKLTEAALGQFGSGWAWLTRSDSGLAVVATANQDSPWSLGVTPLLGIDVWEHAYYLKYQNRRPEYVENFFKVINWEEVNRRFLS